MHCVGQPVADINKWDEHEQDYKRALLNPLLMQCSKDLQHDKRASVNPWLKACLNLTDDLHIVAKSDPRYIISEVRKQRQISMKPPKLRVARGDGSLQETMPKASTRKKS